MKSRYGAYKDHKKEHLYLSYTVYTVKVNQTGIKSHSLPIPTESCRRATKTELSISSEQLMRKWTSKARNEKKSC